MIRITYFASTFTWLIQRCLPQVVSHWSHALCMLVSCCSPSCSFSVWVPRGRAERDSQREALSCNSGDRWRPAAAELEIQTAGDTLICPAMCKGMRGSERRPDRMISGFGSVLKGRMSLLENIWRGIWKWFSWTNSILVGGTGELVKIQWKWLTLSLSLTRFSNIYDNAFLPLTNFPGNPCFHCYTVVALLWIFWNSTESPDPNQAK